MRPQDLPDDQRDIFRRWNEIAEFYRIDIQVFVVEAVFYFLFDQIGKPAQVDHHARIRVDFTRNLYFQFVVVPMVIRVVAQAEHFFVALVRPGRVVQAVGGVEMGFAKNGYVHF